MPRQPTSDLPLSLYAYDEVLRNKINSALYVGSASGTLDGSGRVDLRVFRRHCSGSQDASASTRHTSCRLETSVTVNGKPVQAYPSWPAGFGDQGTAPSYAAARIDYFAGDKVERLAAKKISGGNTLRGPLQWAGPQDQYFAAIFLPDSP